MLKSLSINNIVLIDKAEIEFSLGLCVLTGETGSGKSILLDALGLVIGFRSNLRLIGNDQNKAQVSAEFDISNNLNCQNFLREHDLLDVENHNLIRIRRIISESSQEKITSKVYVNDILVGVNLLSELGENLIEIHGQHDQRGLLNSNFHGQILDNFSDNQIFLKDLKKTYEEIKIVDEKISEIKDKKEQAKREKDYLEFVVKELQDAEIKIGEEAELSSIKDQIRASGKILNFLSDLKLNLLEANSNLTLSQKILIRNQNLINNYLSEEQNFLEKLSEKIDQQNIDLESVISDIENLNKKLNNSSKTLEEVEDRLFYIRSLARKFNKNCDELPQIILEAQEKLKLLENEEELSQNLVEKKNQLLKKYHEIAQELSLRRQEAAKILAKKVEEELKFLKMDNTKFQIELTKNDPTIISSTGYEKAHFLASINKNNFDEITKIASGGELSRFMLALKVALMKVKSTPTIIFDEIDTGIGGSTADAVGKRLKILSENVQILVVTHQPQIAAKSDLHFKISKINNSDKIKTIIEKLDENNRQQEIARMLSGEEVTLEALAAANRLIY